MGGFYNIILYCSYQILTNMYFINICRYMYCNGHTGITPGVMWQDLDFYTHLQAFIMYSIQPTMNIRLTTKLFTMYDTVQFTYNFSSRNKNLIKVCHNQRKKRTLNAEYNNLASLIFSNPQLNKHNFLRTLLNRQMALLVF